MIPYSDIKSVRVIDYANFGEVHGQCTVKARGQGSLKIRSHHFVSIGKFENRSGTYVPFVRELCRRVHAANPEAQFLRGSGWIQALWAGVLVVSGLGAVLSFAAVINGGQDFQMAAGFLLGFVVATIVSWRWCMRSKPDLFDPMEPPLGRRQD